MTREQRTELANQALAFVDGLSLGEANEVVPILALAVLRHASRFQGCAAILTFTIEALTAARDGALSFNDAAVEPS